MSDERFAFAGVDHYWAFARQGRAKSTRSNGLSPAAAAEAPRLFAQHAPGRSNALPARVLNQVRSPGTLVFATMPLASREWLDAAMFMAIVPQPLSSDTRDTRSDSRRRASGEDPHPRAGYACDPVSSTSTIVRRRRAALSGQPHPRRRRPARRERSFREPGGPDRREFPGRKDSRRGCAGRIARGAHQLCLSGDQRAKRVRSLPDRRDGCGHRVRVDRGQARSQAAGRGVRSGHQAIRLPAHDHDASDGARGLPRPHAGRATADRNAAVLDSACRGPQPGTAPGHSQRQPGARRPHHGAAGRGRPPAQRDRKPGQHERAVHRQDGHVDRGRHPPRKRFDHLGRPSAVHSNSPDATPRRDWLEPSTPRSSPHATPTSRGSSRWPKSRSISSASGSLWSSGAGTRHD